MVRVRTLLANGTRAWMRASRAGAAAWLAAALVVPTLAAYSASPNDPADARHRAVDALFAQFSCPGTPGGAVGIYQDGRMVYSGGYGCADMEHDVPVTPRTVFHVASVSKQFTAFAIALLAREGKVNLDADIRVYLPYLPDFGGVITVRQLVHHTSGLRDQWQLFDLAGREMRDVLKQKQILNMAARQSGLNFEPGTEYSYSNLGYTLLAEIVEAASGRTLRQYTSERMFRPLGMTRTFFYDDVTEIVPDRAHSYARGKDSSQWMRALLNFDNVGATSLHTTVEDLAKWTANFSHPVVGDASLIEQIGAPGRLRDGTAIDYGFALWRSKIAGEDVLMHTGGDAGFATIFVYYPKRDFAVALLMNASSWSMLEPTVAAIAKLYLPRAPQGQGGTAIVEPDPGLLKAMVGYYQSPVDQRVSLTYEGGKLLWSTVGDGSAPIVFRADGSFDLGERTWAYRLHRDGRGRIDGIEEIAMGGGQHPRLMPRVENFTPSEGSLAELAGDYRSPELDITYTFDIRDGRLTARSLWSVEPIIFTPVGPDRFDSPHWGLRTITIERDREGRPTGIRSHSHQMRGVFLQRVSPAPVLRH